MKGVRDNLKIRQICYALMINEFELKTLTIRSLQNQYTYININRNIYE